MPATPSRIGFVMSDVRRAVASTSTAANAGDNGNTLWAGSMTSSPPRPADITAPLVVDIHTGH